MIHFRPDRWDAVPDAANAIPGVWSHLFSFLGGPHNCIGWRFSLAECVIHSLSFYPIFVLTCRTSCRMKCLLYTLIRTFEFELAVSPEELTVGRTAVQRPTLISDPTKPQLPMRVRRVQA